MTNNQVNEYHRGQLVQIDENNGNQKYNYYPNVLLDDVYVSDIVTEGLEENQVEFLETVPLQQRINIGEGANSKEFSLNEKNVNGIAIGYNAKGNTGIVIGNNSRIEDTDEGNTKDISGIVIGHVSKVEDRGGVSIGDLSSAGSGVSIGTSAQAKSGSAIGTSAQAKDGFAGGKGAKAMGENSIAIGAEAQADSDDAADKSISIGYKAKAMKRKSIAIGGGAQAKDVGSIAIGNSKSETVNDSDVTVAKGAYSIAIGYNAVATGNNSIQLGSNIGTTQTKPNTLNFRTYEIVDENGHIPAARLSKAMEDYSKTKIYYGTESVEGNWENKPAEPANGTIYFQIT